MDCVGLIQRRELPMDWVHQRIKEIREAGMRIDQEVAKKYMLGESEPSPDLKQTVKPIEMDAIDIDFEMPERDE